MEEIWCVNSQSCSSYYDFLSDENILRRSPNLYKLPYTSTPTDIIFNFKALCLNILNQFRHTYILTHTHRARFSLSFFHIFRWMMANDKITLSFQWKLYFEINRTRKCCISSEKRPEIIYFPAYFRDSRLNHTN